MTQAKTGLYDRFIHSVPFMSGLQDWVIDLGGRPSAMRWLLTLSFLESIFFPVPVDPLMGMVVLARPGHYIRIALMTALASVAGGVAGWWIGVTVGDAIIAMGWIGREGAYASVAAAFAEHGWVLLLIGAFTPLPYKVVVVSAGFLGIGIIPLIVASLIGRSGRFLLVAGIVRYRRNTALAGGLTAILTGLVVFFWWYTH